MAGISDSDKLGMAALLASMEDSQTVNRAKKSNMLPFKKKAATKRRKITVDDVKSGRVSEGDANDELMIQMMQDMRGYKNGGMIDRAAVRGKTKGKIC
jgi:hypothetical protein